MKFVIADAFNGDLDEDIFYEMTEHRMYCSRYCFKEYYGEFPVVGKCYKKLT